MNHALFRLLGVCAAIGSLLCDAACAAEALQSGTQAGVQAEPQLEASPESPPDSPRRWRWAKEPKTQPAVAPAVDSTLPKSAETAPELYSFAVFGDMPYDDIERGEITQILRQMSDEEVVFAAHLGDFKSDQQLCDDALYDDRLQMFNAAPLPLVYTPGEHDWASCDHPSAGKFVPQERLNALRRSFFAHARSLGTSPFALERQSDINYSFGAFQEHLRWIRGPVLFMTLNLPGNDNHIGKPSQPSPEYLIRSAAVRNWLETSFALARERKLRGVVILTHANPDFIAWAAGTEPRGYGEFLRALQAEVEQYNGEVLFIHGDTHVMRNDRPVLNADGSTLRRFREVEVYGSPLPGWVTVTVDSNDNNLFDIRPHPLRAEDGSLQ